MLRGIFFHYFAVYCFLFIRKIHIKFIGIYTHFDIVADTYL